MLKKPGSPKQRRSCYEQDGALSRTDLKLDTPVRSIFGYITMLKVMIKDGIIHRDTLMEDMNEVKGSLKKMKAKGRGFQLTPGATKIP